jgi:hypothetical protein
MDAPWDQSQFNMIIEGRYNYDMSKMKVRLILTLIVLGVSLILLIWGFWPAVRRSSVLPLPPDSLRISTPIGAVPNLWMSG